MEADKRRFELILNESLLSAHECGGIGTYKEFTLHMVLKRYYSGSREYEEVPTGAYIADVKIGNRITEIQTSGISSMKKKLEAFSRENHVTVVYPLVVNKTVAWVDSETGEVVSRGKSPKHPKPAVILKELGGIKELIGNPNISFDIAIVEATDYKLLDGRGKDKKIGATKIDRVPTELVDIIHLSNIDDIRSLVPLDDGAAFTAADFKKMIGLSAFSSSIALSTLRYLGIAVEVRKKGNCKIYEIR